MKISKKISALSLILAIITVFSFSGVFSSGKSVKEIKQSGKIVIGTSGGYAPFEYYDKNKLVGFDVDLANEIAKDLKVKVEIKDMQFDGLIAALKSGSIDLAIAGMNPKPERRKSVDFSDIYYNGKQVFIVKKGDENKYKSLKSLSGKQIGAQKGTTCADVAKTIKGAKVTELPKVADEILQLNSGMVKGFVVDEPVAKLVVKANKGIVISKNINIETKDNGFAVAIEKGNTELTKAVNSTISRMTKSGMMDKLVLKYFK